VKLVEVEYEPPAVEILIGPVAAPEGTVAVTDQSDAALKLAAATPPKVTALVDVRFAPLILTDVPATPCDGLYDAMVGAGPDGAGGGGGAAESTVKLPDAV
jgi:hypothetical protein